MPIQAFNELQPDDRNPRTMNKHQANVLYNSLTEFGDLSPIVFNRANNKLVSGHMRRATFERLGGQKNVTIVQSWDEAKSAGTIAVGYIGYGDEYYAYREVMFNEATHAAAMTAANRVGGDWDFEKLADINEFIKQQDEALLALTGETEDELRRLEQLGSSPEPEKSEHDDDRLRMDFKMTDQQSIIVDQAIAEAGTREITSTDGNQDLRANAIVQICQTYLDSLDDSQTT